MAQVVPGLVQPYKCRIVENTIDLVSCGHSIHVYLLTPYSCNLITSMWIVSDVENYLCTIFYPVSIYFVVISIVDKGW